MITFNNKAAKEHYLDILTSLNSVHNLKQEKKKTQNNHHKPKPHKNNEPPKNPKLQKNPVEQDTEFYVQLIHWVIDNAFP